VTGFVEGWCVGDAVYSPLSPASQLIPPTDQTTNRSSETDKSPHKRQVEAARVSLTRGQVNAVRAAFKAGIKPSLIVRQFRISLSDVRKVLASP
jgi:hypothetical protein